MTALKELAKVLRNQTTTGELAHNVYIKPELQERVLKSIDKGEKK